MLLKTKKVGNYRINKYPKAIWVSSLPNMKQIKKFNTFSEAEKWCINKTK